MTYIIHQLVLETIPKQSLMEISGKKRNDEKVERFYFGSKINQYFRVLIRKKRVCKNRHQVIYKDTTMGLLLKTVRKDDKFLTVNQLVDEYLDPRIISYPCKKCKKWNWGVEQNFFIT